MSLPLDRLHCLIVDCQTTAGGRPGANLLEIGWAEVHMRPYSHAPFDISAATCILAPCDDTPLPPRTTRITGLKTADLCAAVSPRTAWHQLCRTARRIADANRCTGCPTLIHYARFETPLLKALHEEAGDGRPFPLDIICTHDICRRLLAELPRKGLRAVSGYCGFVLPNRRRCASHLTATAVVWSHLIRLLKARGVDTWTQLRQWLASTPVPSRTERRFPMPPHLRTGLPDRAGIYRMTAAGKETLYIGKAGSLNKRVRQYFHQRAPHSERILEMLSQAVGIEWVPTRTALEAALLESDQIKAHAPPYNQALQRGDRKLWYLSADLQSISGLSDGRHPIGPVDAGVEWEAMGHIRTALDGLTRPAEVDFDPSPAVLLALPEAYAPEPDLVRKGLAVFYHRNRNRLVEPLKNRALIRLGKSLWRHHCRLARAGIERETQEDAPEEKGRSSENRQWTEEMVADRIDSLLARCGRAMIRSRWFHLIRNALLVWSADSADAAGAYGIRLQSGRIAAALDLPAGDAIRFPPCGPPPTGSGEWLDIDTYDRLRVLTTEMKRLVAQQRDVRLWLSPTRLLTGVALEKILQEL